MNKRSRLFISVTGRFMSCWLILFLLAGCTPTSKSTEDLAREIGDLKKEVKAMQEKLDKLQAGQQELMEQLKKSSRPEFGAGPYQPYPMYMPPPAMGQPQAMGQLPGMAQPQAMAQPQGSTPLTVSQLLAGKEKYLGAQVTVKGPVGPVVVQHKSLFLKSPEGMVEVFFGKLPDPKQVQTLASGVPAETLTVTGVVSLAPKIGAAKLRIDAEAVQF